MGGVLEKAPALALKREQPYGGKYRGTDTTTMGKVLERALAFH